MTARKRMMAASHPLAFTAMVVTAIAMLLLLGASAGAQSTPKDSVAAQPDSTNTVTFRREVFSYDAAGRRDPFVSLVKSSEIRPTLSDLRLTTIAYDPQGRNSVAVLRDIGTKEQYRVKVGTPLGRMRVVSIQPKIVTFALEEFGFSRQESLAIGDTTIKRTP
jgi:hypothetical protein